MSRKWGHPPISFHSADHLLPKCSIVSLPFSRAAAFIRRRLSPWRHRLGEEALEGLCHDNVEPLRCPAAAADGCSHSHMVSFFSCFVLNNKERPSLTASPLPATDHKTLNLSSILLNIPYSFHIFLLSAGFFHSDVESEFSPLLLTPVCSNLNNRAATLNPC